MCSPFLIFNSQFLICGRRSRPYKYPPTPAMIMTQIGEKPSSQMMRADATGIQILYRLILADFAMLNVGAAISATTAGRIPLKIRSTTTLSLKL